MNIGIVLGETSDVRGGGYTVALDLAQSFLSLDAPTPHALTFFGFAPIPVSGRQTIRFVSLSRRWTTKVIAKCAEVAGRCTARLRFPLHPPSIKSSFEQFCLKLFHEHQIHLLIYVEQNFFATFEIPYITIVWDLEHRRQPYFPEVSRDAAWTQRDRISRMCIQRAAAVIVGTQAGKEEVERFYQPASEGIHIIPLPTPRFALATPTANQADLLKPYALPPNYLFYPAQFWPHKNHAGLLRAVHLLREREGLTLPVVFSGTDKGNLMHIKQIVAELNLTAQVFFLGFVAQDMLTALYRQALALAFLTFFGPDNLPPLEAMALGCPVIASNVPGAAEQLGQAALLVDPNNVQHIAQAIQTLHAQPELRRQLISAGRARATRWTSKEYVAQLLTIIDDFEAIRQCWL